MATWGRVAVWVALLAGLAAAAAPLVAGRVGARGRGRGGRPDRTRGGGPHGTRDGDPNTLRDGGVTSIREGGPVGTRRRGDGRRHGAGGRGGATALLAVSATAALAATALLVRALVAGDHSLVYVADFSRRGASWPYRAAALWGGMAGSLLWLATLIGLAGLGAALRVGDRTRREGVAAVTGGSLAVLVALVVAFADPFATLDVPAVDGAGLTPILEHSAMLYHPPLLYLGLATLVGPFALTVSALVDHRLDDAWLATVRHWSLLPWTLLAVGMVAGAHWAYVELGWGGYWAWDPVENTALLPWLAVTVLLHAVRGAGAPQGVDAGPPPVGRVAVAGLACLPFVLALLGSLLTRSGATSSVHAFAESRAIGRALAVVVVGVVVALAVLLRRAAAEAGAMVATGGTTATGGAVANGSTPRTREQAAAGTTTATGGAAATEATVPSWSTARTGGQAVAAASGDAPRPTRGAGFDRPARTWLSVTRLVSVHLAVVGAALAVVLAGTLWPLWADLRGRDGIAIEGRYFAQFTGPLAGVALALMCLVPVAVAGRRHRAGVRGLAAAAAAGAVSAVILLLAAAPTVDLPPVLLGAAAGACAATGIVGAGRALRARSHGATSGGHLAHAALGVLVLGIAGTATGGSELVSLRPGESATVLGHTVVYDGVGVEDGPVAGSDAVVADVRAGGRHLRPALVAYPDRGAVLAETSLHSTPLVDLQVILRTARDDGTALLEIGVHPLQVLVWWGGLAVVAAGAFATWEAGRRRSAAGATARAHGPQDDLALVAGDPA